MFKIIVVPKEAIYSFFRDYLWPIHLAGSSVNSAFLRDFTMVICEKICFEEYTNDQYI